MGASLQPCAASQLSCTLCRTCPWSHHASAASCCGVCCCCNRQQSTRNKGSTKNLPIPEQRLASKNFTFPFPAQMRGGCSSLHFHFCGSRPVYKKAWPVFGVARVLTVQIGCLFQKHLSEHNHILFCQRPARRTAGAHAAPRCGRPSHFMSCCSRRSLTLTSSQLQGWKLGWLPACLPRCWPSTPKEEPREGHPHGAGEAVTAPQQSRPVAALGLPALAQPRLGGHQGIFQVLSLQHEQAFVV